jgi:D-sedoheptulose 7-phosphate isomerase
MSNDEALQEFYPFLHGRKADAHALNVALVESVRQKAQHHQDVFGSFFAKNGQSVVDTAQTIADVYRRDGRLFSMGNGGSSCDAAHVAVEFLHPITAGRPALTAIDLTCDSTMMTAIGNDVGFDHIFVRQIIAQGRPGDSLIGISTSGNSANLVKAFRKAKEIGLRTIGLTGNTGGEIGLDHCLIVETDIHRIQECHVAIYHILWDLVHTLLADERGNLHIRAAE